MSTVSQWPSSFPGYCGFRISLLPLPAHWQGHGMCGSMGGSVALIAPWGLESSSCQECRPATLVKVAWMPSTALFDSTPRHCTR